VVASTLLGTSPPRLPGRVLVQAAGLFGIAEGTARVALSRMVSSGELEAADGWYALAGPRLLARQARQETGRTWRSASAAPWGGTWILAAVVAERRDAAERAALRDALTRARLGELREGVWLRPDNIDVDWPPVAREHCTTMHAGNVDPSVARGLWDLADWASQAVALRARMKPLVRPLERGDTDPLAEGFVVSAAVLRMLQSDPLLPSELLPGRWPGDALRDDYDRFDTAYRAVLRAWFALR
jgi:phenylacetic acid degradation operon negative regulatory protein